MPKYGEERRRKIDQAHAGDRAGEPQGRVAQLRIGRAGHHASDIADTRIGADAAHPLGEAEPDRPLALHQAAERAVVDERAADGVEPARGLQRLAPHEHAPARGGGRPVRGIVHPGERIELLEEEYESRDEHALGEAFAAQLHHERGQDGVLGQAPARQPLQRVGRVVNDVGVGEEDERGRFGLSFGVREALPHGPEFSRPAGRPVGAADSG
jgi:hypothetical protein